MGCFSFINANRKGDHANIVENERCRILIPKEYGGGYIEGKYNCYGEVISKNGTYDIHELVATFNHEIIDKVWILRLDEEKLQFDGEFKAIKPVDDYTENNRGIGITLTMSKELINALPYPPKIVDKTYEGTYEDCKGISYSDPYQGSSKLSWDSYNEIKNLRSY